MYPYPGKKLIDRAEAAMNANPNSAIFKELYLFVLHYSKTYTTKSGRVCTGRFGVDGAVTKKFGNISSHVVR